MNDSEAKEGLQDDEPDLKVIVLGDSACGKSKLIERFMMDDYHSFQLSTHALTLLRKEVTFGDGSKKLKVDFWDTAGQEEFNYLHPSYYYKADACILVFDVTRRQTYLSLERWYKEVRVYCPNIPCIVVANKIDVDALVTKKNFQFPRRHNLSFFFVSSADGTNVVQAFKDAIRSGHAYRQFGRNDLVLKCLSVISQSTGDVIET